MTSPQGRTWSVAPHISGLPSAEGGFETPLGWFGVKWSVTNGTFDISLEAPEGTSGVVRLPFTGAVTVDGSDVDAPALDTIQLRGGNHTVTVHAQQG